MKRFISRSILSAALAVGALGFASSANAQVAYGVNAAGQLFSFDVSAPGTTSTVGTLGFVPEGIDFRPGSDILYAIDVGAATTQLYTIDRNTAVATPIGAGFASAGVSPATYDLVTGASAYGFDINPTTLQGDTSFRIRLTANNRSNLRLNSSTGGIAAVDGQITYAAGDPNVAAIPTVSGSAYTRSNILTVAGAGGATTLFNIDPTTDAVSQQNPPNNGTLVTVGALGVNAVGSVGFDIFTDAGGVNSGYAVINQGSGYQLHTINLGTGAAGPGATVGAGADFTGGFAVVAPEPSSLAILLMGALGLAGRRRRA